MNDIAYVFSNEGAGTHLFMEYAEKHHETLIMWYLNLPEALQTENDVLPPHLFLQYVRFQLTANVHGKDSKFVGLSSDM
jgi:hypothetical protein